MKKHILYTLLLFILFIYSYAQKYRWEENLIRKAMYQSEFKKDPYFNPDLKLGLEIIDSKIDSIVKMLTPSFEPATFTIITASPIDILKVLTPLEFVLQTSYSTKKIWHIQSNPSYHEIWVKSEYDIETYIKSIIKFFRGRGLHYYEKLAEIDGKIIISNQKLEVNKFKHNIDFKHLVYNSSKINDNLKILFSKTIDKKRRTKLTKYLSKNVHNINISDFSITSQAIRINYFYCLDDILNFGMDIYGTHYLLSINKPEKKLTSVKEKWTY